MALGEITKQLAGQAIRNAVNPPAAPPPKPETAGETIFAQLIAMQKALKEEDELVVLFRSGADILRVLECFFPSWQVAVLTGVDTERQFTRAVCHVESLQLVCKVAKAAPGAAATRIKFVAPGARGDR